MLVLAPGRFAGDAKTAHGVIRYSRDSTVAVVDPALAGQRVRDVLPYLQSDAPIVASVREGFAFSPTSLLIGTAPKGGRLPPDWRAEVLTAIGAGLEIVSGLHDMLADDAEFAQCGTFPAAQRFGTCANRRTFRCFPEAFTSFDRRLCLPSETTAPSGNDRHARTCARGDGCGDACRVRSHGTNRNHDRRMGHCGRSRHLRLCRPAQPNSSCWKRRRATPTASWSKAKAASTIRRMRP